MGSSLRSFGTGVSSVSTTMSGVNEGDLLPGGGIGILGEGLAGGKGTLAELPRTSSACCSMSSI